MTSTPDAAALPDECPTCGAPATYTPAGSNHVVGDWNESWEFDPDRVAGLRALVEERNLTRQRLTRLVRALERYLARPEVQAPPPWYDAYQAAYNLAATAPPEEA